MNPDIINLYKESPNIPITRLKHCYGVGKLMKDIARKLGNPEKYCRDMFLLGLLHDFAYDYTGKDVNCGSPYELRHENIGGKILRDNGYRYWREVYYHSRLSKDCEGYSSFELNLLNYCDHFIDGQGNRVGPEIRLVDIANRYGLDSADYKLSSALIKELTDNK